MAVSRSTSVVSEEELQLRKKARRRLVGAIALVAIAVIVLPLMLDHEPSEPLRDVRVEMAPQAAAPNAAVPAAPTPGPPVQAPPAPSAESTLPGTPAPAPAGPTSDAAQAAAPPSGVAPESAPVARAPATTPTAAEPKPFAVAPKPVQPAEFVIQLGAFAEPGRAQAMEQRLRKAGFPVYLERVRETNRTRVRAGPYGSREAAERAYQQMKQRGLADTATAGQIVPRGQ
jgi:DedD protein